MVAAARRGAPGAFAQLVARHQQAVRSFLRRALLSEADAEDVAQETFLAAWARLWRYRGQASFRSWLCAIAWKKALSLQRARGRERSRYDQLDEPAPAASGADARLDLDRALGTLPDDQRAAVALCLGGGFSHAEAADALGLPLGTIKSHVQRGRAKLLQVLGDSDE
ncbi:MAG TPA: RNA polymerase sigma factor [Caulobacteraceae bacterium]|nr:RNA polymerase sigma factor [Caulobacteraceae bacterium]